MGLFCRISVFKGETKAHIEDENNQRHIRDLSRTELLSLANEALRAADLMETIEIRIAADKAEKDEVPF